MKIEFLLENIEKHLSSLGKILPIHSQVPVLSNLLLEATSTGFFISATNLEIGIKIKIPAKIEEEGATTIPGKQFIEVLGSLPKEKISLYDEKNNLIVKCRDNKVSFQTIGKEEFPNIFEEKGESISVFDSEEINRIFSKTTFAVAVDESRPELTGVLLSQGEDGIDFVATDGFRLSLTRLAGKKILENGERLILPARVIQEVIGLKATSKIEMFVYQKANQVIFETDDVTLVGRLISGDFPNYERVIPKSSKTKIVVDHDDFVQKIKLSSVFARDAANIIRLKVEDGKIKVFAKTSGLGEGEVLLDGEKTGEDNEIAFNVKFLSDLLRNVNGKTVSLELSSPVEPAIFKTDNDKNFLHIIMPVRVQE